MKAQLSLDDLECISDFSTQSSSADCENFWLYSDVVNPPDFDGHCDYYERCAYLSETKNCLEELLKNHQLVNSFLDNECRYQNLLIKRKESSSSLPLPKEIELQPLKLKKARRTNNEIEKSYCCPIRNCGKTYGTRDAQNFHVRRKHPVFDEQRKKERKEALLGLKELKQQNTDPDCLCSS